MSKELVNEAEVTEVTLVEPKERTKIGQFFYKIGQIGFIQWWVRIWKKFKKKYPGFAQFFVFFMVSNGVTVLQMAMMAIIRPILANTSLIDVGFQWLQVGIDEAGAKMFVFNYPAGLASNQGGLAYFLSYTVTIALAQVINFFAQRNITFKSDGNKLWAAMWYVIAFVAIIFIAAFAQGFYRAPIYDLLERWFGHSAGYATADIVTMIINSAISFWVFFPIFKLIFPQSEEKKKELAQHDSE